MDSKRELSNLERNCLCATRLEEIIEGNNEFLEMLMRCGVKVEYILRVKNTIEFQKQFLIQFKKMIKEGEK